MESARVTRVLIVANRTASTHRLIEAVGSRAKASPCEFALLIPDVSNRREADWTLETAQRSLRRAARGNVEGLVGGPDPFESVKAGGARRELRRDHHLHAVQEDVEVASARPDPPGRNAGPSRDGHPSPEVQGRLAHSRQPVGGARGADGLRQLGLSSPVTSNRVGVTVPSRASQHSGVSKPRPGGRRKRKCASQGAGESHPPSKRARIVRRVP